MTSPKLKVNSVRDLVALAKSKPGQVNYGSVGIADVLYLTVEMLKVEANIDVVSIPYKGQAQIGVALRADEVQFAIVSMSTNMPNVRAGNMRALAVTGGKRSKLAPELPIFAESGFPSVESSSWFGIFAPAGTPRDIIQRVQRASTKVLSAPEMRDHLINQGQDAVGSTPEQFEMRFKADVAKYQALVKQVGILPQD